MCLIELSQDYRAHAMALRVRIKELKAHGAGEAGSGELDWRLRTLTAMWREARDLAVLCEHYYERGYRRNEKYTL